MLVDADAHVVEAEFFFQAASRWPDKLRFRDDGTAGFIIEDRCYPQVTGPGAGCPPEHSLNPEAAPNATAAKGMLVDADTEGIDQMVLYPSGALGAASIRDTAFAREFCDAYNDWVASFCAQGDGRLFGVAVAGIEDVPGAIAAMQRGRELGLVGVVLPPALAERNLDHPDLDPFYAACSEASMPVCVHGAPGMHMPKIGVDRFTNYIQVHMVSFPFDMMTALTAVVSGGVLDRHPDLRFAFLEAGCSWLPYFAERMDEHFEKRGDWIPGGWTRPAGEYIMDGRVLVTCEAEERLVPAVLDTFGDRCVMWASDYPHWDGEFPNAGAEFRNRDDLGDAARTRVGSANAIDFYGLDNVDRTGSSPD